MDLCLIPQKYFVPLGGFGDIDVWLHGFIVRMAREFHYDINPKVFVRLSGFTSGVGGIIGWESVDGLSGHSLPYRFLYRPEQHCRWNKAPSAFSIGPT